MTRQRLQHIEDLFMDISIQVGSHEYLSQSLELLAAQEGEFESIAYESASMAIGQRSIRLFGDKRLWDEFVRSVNDSHIFHIQIGLGMAYGASGIFPEVNEMDWKLALRYDGIGYYHALFKGRDTLKSRILPTELDPRATHYFDSGVGRRLWYHCRGGIDQLDTMIASFPNERHPGLWQGLGIATAYVGGLNRNQINELLELSSINKDYFQLGMMLGNKSRNNFKNSYLDLDLISDSKFGKFAKNPENPFTIVEQMT